MIIKLRPGDTIACVDADDLLRMHDALLKEGVRTDWYVDKKAGLYELIVEEVGDNDV